jgi:hypothetical protein
MDHGWRGAPLSKRCRAARDANPQISRRSFARSIRGSHVRRRVLRDAPAPVVWRAHRRERPLGSPRGTGRTRLSTRISGCNESGLPCVGTRAAGPWNRGSVAPRTARSGAGCSRAWKLAVRRPGLDGPIVPPRPLRLPPHHLPFARSMVPMHVARLGDAPAPARVEGAPARRIHPSQEEIHESFVHVSRVRPFRLLHRSGARRARSRRSCGFDCRSSTPPAETTLRRRPRPTPAARRRPRPTRRIRREQGRAGVDINSAAKEDLEAAGHHRGHRREDRGRPALQDQAELLSKKLVTKTEYRRSATR